MQKKCLSGVHPVMKVVSVAARVFAERVNEYVPYMQRTKRSLNDHRTHLTSQVTDNIYFLSSVKNFGS